MDERILERNLVEVFFEGWEIIPTGNGFLIATDWRWPNKDRIEISVRAVGDREDLYLVTDGGNLFNFLFAQEIDLTKDAKALRVLKGVAANYGCELVDYQLAKGANETDLAAGIRTLLETIKDASLILWYKFAAIDNVH